MDAWVGVVGTLAGAIVGAGGTWLIERERRKHERQSRWLTERRQIYAAVLRTADAYHEAVRRWTNQVNAAARGRMKDEDVDEFPDYDDFDAAYFEAELLASWPILLPLERIRASVYSCFDFYVAEHEEGGFSDEEVTKHYGEYDERRGRFVDAVREDLDVPNVPVRPPGRVARMRSAVRRWRDRILK